MYLCLNWHTAGKGLPLEQFVQLAADAGFAGADVDMSYGCQHGAAALSELYFSRNLRFGGWGPLDWRGDAETAGKNLAILKKQARVAGELAIDTCATHVKPSGDLPMMENWKFHVERLKPIAEILGDCGLRLGLEFVAPYHLRRQFKHEFLFTPGQMLELADAVGKNVGLLVDSYHCHTSGTPWRTIAQIPAERIVLVHINDAPRLPLADIEDTARVLPGEGGIDLSGFLSALNTAGYSGPIVLELFNPALRALSPIEAARKARAAAACLAIG